jgi:hypothetical protein
MMIGAELFRQAPRPKAMATAGFTNWVCTLIVALVFPSFNVSSIWYLYLSVGIKMLDSSYAQRQLAVIGELRKRFNALVRNK